VKKTTFHFTSASTDCYFGARFSQLKKLTDPKKTVLVTDQHVYKAHLQLFKGWNCIVLRAGEDYKLQTTVDALLGQLIALGVDRHYTLVGVGGGVVTDLTGYAASIYMRGIRCGFVPTSLLAMVDASLGGKNGVDIGVYKNLAGTIRQPAFLLFDISLLSTLPLKEWRNGFAEIIKHASLFDQKLFKELEKNSLDTYRENSVLLQRLIKKNVFIKLKLVVNDEYESGERRLLNFGHTLGHALEKQYELSHGEAISIGMTVAAALSEKLCHFTHKDALVSLLCQYGLPTYAAFNTRKVLKVLALDKKKSGAAVQYVLLKEIARPVQERISFIKLEKLITSLS
jgi:3-dehydroquinate synthase